LRRLPPAVVYVFKHSADYNIGTKGPLR
jgi:hypothetical protein